jgi:hypothetical protein
VALGAGRHHELAALHPVYPPLRHIALFRALALWSSRRTDNQAKLAAAQAELKNVLSVKQEAQAVLLGLLP